MNGYVLTLSFGILLLVTVLISERAGRTVLSTAVMFLVGGFVLGAGGLHVVSMQQPPELISEFSELALFTILFLDGSAMPLSMLRSAWRLPGRALLLGMPLTVATTALPAHWLLDLPWLEAFLVGAILSPTDPVFVRAILDRERVPLRLRHLLSVESGLNDGLALPLVTSLLALATHQQPHLSRTLLETFGGVLLGIALPALAAWLERQPLFAASEEYRSLIGVAVAAILLGAAKLTHLNEFLAAFVGGVTLASLRPEFAQATRDVGMALGEAVKLAALLIFGGCLTFELLFSTGARGFAFMLIALVVARPFALLFAFAPRSLSRREWLVAAWFGPKGFASLLYALWVRASGARLAHGHEMFAALSLVIVASMLAHSSTDVLVARTFREKENAEGVH